MLLYQKSDLDYATCIYTTSEMEAKHIHELGIKAPTSVIPNGIEIDGYPCRTSIDQVKKQVLFLSRIHEKKGIELLVDAWSELVAEFAGWKLLIVGNGEEGYINKLKDKVRSAGLQDSVAIKPPVFGDAKVQLYQSSSLFVLPSYSENFGMVIAEAMACGVPVITSDNTPWSILNETKTGWCISLSKDNLESTLREAMGKKKEKLFEMGLNASDFVRKEYDYRKVSMRTKSLYEKINEKLNK